LALESISYPDRNMAAVFVRMIELGFGKKQKNYEGK